MTYKDIADASAKLCAASIKGKDYICVNERVKAFRSLCPEGSIETDIISLEDGVVAMKAVVRDETGRILATGLAQEEKTSSYINKTSFIENCETSAVGRALGFLGIGIDTSICSSDELTNALNNQGGDPVFCSCCGKPITATKKKDGSMWGPLDMVAYSTKKFGKQMCADCMKEAGKNG